MGYSDQKYGVIERKWFGLTKKYGGDCAAGFSIGGTTDATAITHVAKWYPKGPIILVKAGSFTLATISGSGVDKIDARVKVRGASASLAASWNAFGAAMAASAGDETTPPFASDSTMSAFRVKAGEYVTIKTGTFETDNGTAKNTATSAGTLAFFIDYRRAFDQTRWNG